MNYGGIPQIKCSLSGICYIKTGKFRFICSLDYRYQENLLNNEMKTEKHSFLTPKQ